MALHGLDSLIELIGNLLRGRGSYGDLKARLADYDWRPVFIALAVTSIVVAALVLVLLLLL